MPVTQHEYQRRKEVKAVFSVMQDKEMIIPVDRKQEIFERAMAEIETKLQKKLEYMIPGEHLVINVDVDIINRNGNVRGGSAVYRNMPEYADWRTAVYERDNYTCQECGSIGQLNAHHIKPWSSHPKLRFDVDNGVTLCRNCHGKKHPHLNFFSDRKN